jgi:transposase-like protein
MTKRKVFSREFKLEAIRLMESGQKKSTDLARELGIPRNRLYKWREQLQRDGKENVFPGKGRKTGPAGEIAALQREIDRLREENDTLKKAARYFAKESA